MKTGQMAKPFDFCWRGKSTISGWKHNMTSLTLVNCFYFVNFFCVSFILSTSCFFYSSLQFSFTVLLFWLSMVQWEIQLICSFVGNGSMHLKESHMTKAAINCHQWYYCQVALPSAPAIRVSIEITSCKPLQHWLKSSLHLWRVNSVYGRLKRILQLYLQFAHWLELRHMNAANNNKFSLFQWRFWIWLQCKINIHGVCVSASFSCNKSK